MKEIADAIKWEAVVHVLWDNLLYLNVILARYNTIDEIAIIIPVVDYYY